MFVTKSGLMRLILMPLIGGFASQAICQEPDGLSLGRDLEYEFIMDFAADIDTKLSIANRVADEVETRIRDQLSGGSSDSRPSTAVPLLAFEVDRGALPGRATDEDEVVIRLIVDASSRSASQLVDIAYSEIARALSRELANRDEET